MPRITAVDEFDNFSKAPKTSQMLLFWTTVLSGNYDVGGGTHATNPLKTKEDLHLIQILPHRDAWETVLPSAVKRPSSLLTVTKINRHH